MHKQAFFFKTALQNIRGNRRFYFPYIIACACSVAIFYIMCSLAVNADLTSGFGGRTIATMMRFGSVVIGVFAVLLLFYTNSFIIKRRHKELGLYNILGMGKKHIALILANETLIIALISLIGGILGGILLCVLALKAIALLLPSVGNIGLSLSLGSMLKCAELFLPIFLLILLYNMLRVVRLQPIELLRGADKGEKEPKSRHIITVFGLLCLGIGYYLSFTTQDPIAALIFFVLAVILVIIGTYALFISGSVTILKRLKKNKSYYYRSKHFISVGDLIYRMKQNGAGLASICILCTMVLVMISTTVSLYTGSVQTTIELFPREVKITVFECNDNGFAALDGAVKQKLSEVGIEINNTAVLRAYSNIPPGKTMNALLAETPEGGIAGTAFEGYAPNAYYFFDLADKNTDYAKLTWALDGIGELLPEDSHYAMYSEYRSDYHEDLLTTIGSLLFLGIFLGILFLAATALIIYYKQINEGYDDRERFIIMHKVGLSETETKRTINSQIKLVFFLPIAAAVMHLLAATPILLKLLALLGLHNTLLYLLCAAATTLFLCLIYALVYKLTANVYCKIIN